MNFSTATVIGNNPSVGIDHFNSLSFLKIKTEKELQEVYPQNLTFYSEPPDDSVSLQQFEQCAIDRLKLLRIFERIGLTAITKYTEDWRHAIDVELKKSGLIFQLLGNQGSANDLLYARKYDHISHYILRLAFCRTDDLRKWLINMEIDFFRYKFMQEGAKPNLEFLEKEDPDDNFCFRTLSADEKASLEQDLKDTFYYVSSPFMTLDIFEVPFSSCLDLVKGRRVLLRKGNALVLHQDLISLICSKFRSSLSKSLTELSNITPLIAEDERLSHILSDFDKRYTGKTYISNKGKDNNVTVEILEQVSENSFPLCMKSLYDTVKTEHHLRHFGRLQLGLFFKGLGLPLEEAIRYWRTNFTKKVGVDGTRFDKQYLYNIRHMYGQEGKRADYTPYSCMKIIMSPVGPGENHGCPFRHSDEIPLRTKLSQANIPAQGVKEIMDLVEKHNYQIACQKYFEWTHAKATVDGGVNHPNQYFEESQNFFRGGAKVKAEDKDKDAKLIRSKLYEKRKASQLPVEEVDGESDSEMDALMASIDAPDTNDVEETEEPATMDS